MDLGNKKEIKARGAGAQMCVPSLGPRPRWKAQVEGKAKSARCQLHFLLGSLGRQCLNQCLHNNLQRGSCNSERDREIFGQDALCYTVLSSPREVSGSSIGELDRGIAQGRPRRVRGASEPDLRELAGPVRAEMGL